MIHEFKTLDLNDDVAISASARIITVLRTHLDETEFRRRLQIQSGEGYSIVYLEVNGEIVALAKRLGRPAPVNARLVGLMRAAEAGERRAWSGPALLTELEAARAADAHRS